MNAPMQLKSCARSDKSSEFLLRIENIYHERHGDCYVKNFYYKLDRWACINMQVKFLGIM